MNMLWEWENESCDGRHGKRKVIESGNGRERLTKNVLETPEWENRELLEDVGKIPVMEWQINRIKDGMARQEKQGKINYGVDTVDAIIEPLLVIILK